MLVLEGAYSLMDGEPQWFAISPPTDEEVREVIQTLSVRIFEHPGLPTTPPAIAAARAPSQGIFEW